MCGIFTLLNNTEKGFDKEFIKKQFKKGKSRGPENSVIENAGTKTILGFHRLAINGLNDKSNQPIIIDDISLICNGEIYNYKSLYKMMDIVPKTDSDCEVIIHLYKKYGIDQTLQMLDGVFAFVLCDQNIHSDTSKLFVARDPYGVRPLYFLKPTFEYESSSLYGFASEIKVLSEFKNHLENYQIEHIKPGTYTKFVMPFTVSSRWILTKEYVKYHSTGFNSILNKDDMTTIFNRIQYYLFQAVKKRVLTTDRPVACLLSGGLDSSLITAIVNDIHKQNNLPQLETYSIGLKGSEDLKYARIVADYLDTNHTEIIVSEREFLDAIPDVIYAIESYDTTTVRASIGNYLLGEYISKHSEAKVIFNGDGSDELCGGYLYMHKAPDAIEFDKECRRLLEDIHAFDVLRSDKCISSHGLEPRTPFLDRSFVQYYLSIHPNIRFHPRNNDCEKYLLRKAFSIDYFENNDGLQLLPDCILWRRKEAFSDGVSETSRSLYQIIQDYLKEKFKNRNPNNYNINHNKPDTIEKQYYRDIFEGYYPNVANVVPYFWMPRYVNATDASARTLQLYNNNVQKFDEKQYDSRLKYI